MSEMPTTPPPEDALEKAFSRERPYRPGETIMKPRAQRHVAAFIVDGIALDVIDAEKSDRMVMRLVTAGHFFGLNAAFLAPQPTSLIAKTYCVVRTASSASIRDLLMKNDLISDILHTHIAADWAETREQARRLRLRSREAIAHLICEVSFKVGAMRGDRPQSFPLTQLEMALATGNSLAQVSRSLSALKSDGLLISDASPVIIDWEGLCVAGRFEPGYLTLTPPTTKPAFCKF